MNRFNVRKVAVLGAGVMGAQIAAHLVNVNVPVVLFDLPAKDGPKNGIVTKAIEGLKKLKPAPLGIARGRGADPGRELRGAPRAARRVRPRHRGDRRAHGLEARPLPTHRAAHRAARDRRQQHLRPVDHEALRSAAGSDPAALLRHPLLQPAALHGAGRTDRDADDATARSSTSSRPSSRAASARAWCAPRTRRTSSPTASASPACWRR